MLPELSQDEILRYSRHLLIPEVGMEGQRKLKAASVLIVGTGGLGSPVSMYLAAAGVGHLGLVDYDVVDSSNLQRQVIHGTDRVGKLKVDSARQRLADLNPYIQVETYNEVFSSENAWRIGAGYDILVDGSDNFPTRYLLNDLAALTGRPYVYGSIFRFEGQVSVFDARKGACYRCLFPEPPPPGMVPSCAEGGVFGVLPGTIGTLQAAEVIKLILRIGEPLVDKLLLYDALDSTMQTVHLRKNPNCRVCGEHPDITHLIDYEEFCGVPTRDAHAGLAGGDWDIEPREVQRRLQNNDSIQLVDVREPIELQISSIPGAVLVPLTQLPQRLEELDRNKDLVLFCRTGVRSARALRLLAGQGYTRLHNLKGGINAWSEQVDPSIKRY
ncbi:dinucleotide-utilizing enzyme [Longilinea arvoryzae]|uniref:Dinucleotide-utilizing enzyme n=1 Tax=Longilinea arvoryzae TaxID=360412 RepID=A0A0S7BLQ2_9CHLR|nr:molybdopterin-synthase adenylyltransferase MoeB [Longilinea arvoryzae]GAP15256.1 dinucleotide-utilizing enzyme [Longilinea arvoryzae]